MKNHIKAISIILTVLCFVSPLFVSCSKEKDIDKLVDDYTNSITDPNFTYTPGDDKMYPFNCLVECNVQAYDGMIYFVTAQKNSPRTVYRLDPQTGVISYVCSDPLCSHGRGCPLYGITAGFFVYNNKLFYNRYFIDPSKKTNDADGNPRVNDFCVYDMSDGKMKVLQNYDYNMLISTDRQIFTGNYRYYEDYVQLDESYEGYEEFCNEHNTVPFMMLPTRMDIETGERTVISTKDSIMNATEKLCFVLDERIYFTDGKRLYSRDMNNENEIVHCEGNLGYNVSTNGKSVYFEKTQPTEDDDVIRSVYYIADMNNYTEPVKIIDNTRGWRLTEKYIYYTDGEDRYYGEGANQKYSLGTQLRRCSHDGTNDELVIKYEGEYYTWQPYQKAIYGNYMYGLYFYSTDDDGDGIYQDYSSDPNLARIDLNTGEVYVIENKLK